jgi:hypothetical protein
LVLAAAEAAANSTIEKLPEGEHVMYIVAPASMTPPDAIK